MPPQTRRRREVTGRVPLDLTQKITGANIDHISLPTHQGANTQSVGQNITDSIQSSSGLHKRKRPKPRIVTPTHSQAKRAQDMAGRPVVVDPKENLIEDGDTEEDKGLAHVDKVPLKQRAIIRKGKSRAQNQIQQTDPFVQLQQPCDDGCDLDPDFLDDFNDGDIENAEDWIGDKHLLGLSSKNPSKLSEALAIERPTWKAAGPPLSQGVGGSTQSTPGVSGISSTPTLSGSSQDSSIDQVCLSDQDIPTTSTPVAAKMPAVIGDETDLVFETDKKQLSLSKQKAMVQLVIRASFEIIYSSLLFTDAFPEGPLVIQMIKSALLRSALNQTPRAMSMYMRLQHDHVYFSKIMPLPRVRISIFRSEVKDLCCAVIAPVMENIGDEAEIVNAVEKQLWDYTYTFPNALNYPLSRGLCKRSRPYRNVHIITAIRELFFSGGSASFASRFDDLFVKIDVGSSHREVPPPMVCLVATGIYAALHEWRTGRRQDVEFTSSTFHDVYTGHVNTLKYIQESRVEAYHSALTNIYALASAPAEGTPGMEIAPINIDELE